MSITINGNGTITGYEAVANGSITTAKLADGAASPEKLGDNIVIQTSIVATPNVTTVTNDGNYTMLSVEL